MRPEAFPIRHSNPFPPVASVLALVLAAPASAQTALDAGPDRNLLPPETTIALSGSLNVPAGLAPTTLDSVSWRQLTGPPAFLSTPDRLETDVLPTAAGVMSFELSAETAKGRLSDTVTVYNFAGSAVGLSNPEPTSDAPLITGDRKAWHKLTFTFTHERVLSETSMSPNPFLDLRLLVHLVNLEDPNELVTVPGYFAADGRAAETGAEGGDKWRAHYRPARHGKWFWIASFVSGTNIAVDTNPTAGTRLSFDGLSGQVEIRPADPRSLGFERKGLLRYVGKHHLRFAETGEWFLKAGSNSPENFLGYYEFDNTFDQGGLNNDLASAGYQDGLHHYDAHLGDYVDLGVETWKGGKGQRIFGAINYLASKGINSLYFITYNLDGGDGREVWPWRSGANKRSYDVSKLDQWGRVFDHMTRAGVALHVLTQETENDHAIDGGQLGVTRKLYYRELIARFGDALGLFWNLGEENDNSTAARIDFAEYIREVDPYDHPITVLARSDQQNNVYDPLLGTHLEVISLQGAPADADDDTQAWVTLSDERGRAWSVCFDEVGPANDGVVPDSVDPEHDTIRKEVLWGGLMAQGGGPEWYFGYAHPHADLDCEDFRSRDRMWELTRNAVDFLQRNVPFQDMEHADHLTSAPNVGVLAKPGDVYAMFLPNPLEVNLDLENHPGTFTVRWYDPLAGGSLQTGSKTEITGPGFRGIGLPPDTTHDWAAVIRRKENRAPVIESFEIVPNPFPGNTDFALTVHVDDPDGIEDILHVRIHVITPAGNDLGSIDAVYVGGQQWALHAENFPVPPPGTWNFVAVARDRTFTADLAFQEVEVP